jgi:Zn-finger nucleic acid-binding protein
MTLKEGQEFLTCPYCGTMHFPDPNSDGVRVLEVPSALNCPICAVPLVNAAVSGQRMLYCTRCHGMLFSMDVFLAAAEDLRSRRETSSAGLLPADWDGLNRHINCPQCGSRMDTHLYGGPGNVIIDTCEKCSFDWLDFGEMERIVRAPDPHYEFEGPRGKEAE